jgi:OOP family OmpA-OmpF porin
MNKKLLCAALLSGLAVAQTVSAQDFDSRWYLTTSAGFNLQDGDRGTHNAPFGTIGFGKFINDKWSLDGQFNYQNPHFENQSVIRAPYQRAINMNWSQYGVSVDLRRHFTAEGRNWNPYALVGLGYQRSEEEFDNFPNPNSPGQRTDGNLAAKVGLGLQGDLGRVGIRAEVAYRADFDDTSVNAAGEDWFGDVLASVGFVVPLGPEAAAPVVDAPPPPPPVANCADKDSDGDGVNDCNDKCPNSMAGETIGPDGCKVKISIDLKGVNFNFDKATLRPDAVSILNEAVEILKRYPDIRVEVAGHTDLCGNDGYNQDLSQRRAQAVYDYLTKNGVDAGRLAGPTGYGESRPLVQTAQTLPECKNETNRRTELNVQ